MIKQRLLHVTFVYTIFKLALTTFIFYRNSCFESKIIKYFWSFEDDRVLKRPLQTFTLQRNEKQCIKNKCIPDYIYSLFTL